MLVDIVLLLSAAYSARNACHNAESAVAVIVKASRHIVARLLGTVTALCRLLDAETCLRKAARGFISHVYLVQV